MIDLEYVKEHCPKSVYEIATHCDNSILKNDRTYLMVHADGVGVQFETKDNKKYMELDIREDEMGITISIYLEYTEDEGEGVSPEFSNIDDAVRYWNIHL